MLKKLLSFILCFSCLFVAAPAMETDQYNLPNTPLADIGDELTQYVWDNIFEAAATLNAEIDAHQACLNGTPTPSRAYSTHCKSAVKEQAKLGELRSSAVLAKEVYKRLGDGTIFTSHTGDWLTTHEFSQKPARYKTSFTDSIFVAMPVDYATLSPTIRVNGVEMGTDKWDHFFQQGYRYYTIYSKQLRKGKAPDDAVPKAISWGKMTERTIYGYLVSGVFSNADLYANYVGMKFYLGLTQPIKIGDETRAATFMLADGKWQVNSSASERNYLLAPFVSEQMNEALNPSGYTSIVYLVVREVVKNKSCPQWRTAFPSITKNEIEARSRSLEQWNGEDYGFSHRRKMISLAEICFSD